MQTIGEKKYNVLQTILLVVIEEKKYSKLQTIGEKEYNILQTIYSLYILQTNYQRKKIQCIVDNTKTIREKKYSNLTNNIIYYYTNCQR